MQCVCVCVFMFVCVYVLYVSVYMCVCVRSVCVGVCGCVWVFNLWVYACLDKSICMSLYISIYMSVCVCAAHMRVHAREGKCAGVLGTCMSLCVGIFVNCADIHLRAPMRAGRPMAAARVQFCCSDPIMYSSLVTGVLAVSSCMHITNSGILGLFVLPPFRIICSSMSHWQLGCHVAGQFIAGVSVTSVTSHAHCLQVHILCKNTRHQTHKASYSSPTPCSLLA